MIEEDAERGNYKSPTDVKTMLSIIGVSLLVIAAAILVGM